MKCMCLFYVLPCRLSSQATILFYQTIKQGDIVQEGVERVMERMGRKTQSTKTQKHKNTVNGEKAKKN